MDQQVRDPNPRAQTAWPEHGQHPVPNRENRGTLCLRIGRRPRMGARQLNLNGSGTRNQHDLGIENHDVLENPRRLVPFPNLDLNRCHPVRQNRFPRIGASGDSLGAAGFAVLECPNANTILSTKPAANAIPPKIRRITVVSLASSIFLVRPPFAPEGC